MKNRHVPCATDYKVMLRFRTWSSRQDTCYLMDTRLNERTLKFHRNGMSESFMQSIKSGCRSEPLGPVTPTQPLDLCSQKEANTTGISVPLMMRAMHLAKQHSPLQTSSVRLPISLFLTRPTADIFTKKAFCSLHTALLSLWIYFHISNEISALH